MGALSMARKNLLSGLMGDQTVQPDTAASPAPATAQPARPRYSKGAIGAVSQSLADLKSRAIADIHPAAIDPGGLPDRLEEDPVEHAALMASLRDHGQQVPVLLRPHPTEADRYQVVYGRRRVRALRDLGQPVKAMIRDLDDRALVMAQGQENAARRDLTFIEKANFAAQMRAAGYDRKAICAALHVDKTQISRMLAVADAVPLDLVEAIGAAPSVGRNRWLALAARLDETGTDTAAAVALVHAAEADDSDARFAALLRALARPQAQPPEPRILRDDAGREIGRMVWRGDTLTLTVPLAGAEGFDDWLAENFDRIHADWRAGGGDES